MPTRDTSNETVLCNGGLPAHVQDIIDNEVRTAGEALRAKRKTEFVLAMLATEPKSAAPVEVKHVPISDYATSRSISRATVLRYRNEGMPVVYVGTSMRIDPVAADEWRQHRGRKPTTADRSMAKSPDDEVDVSASLALAGLRAVAGDRR